MRNTETRRRALIVIPPGGPLPLAEPAGGVVEVGFFLVELAQILKRFEHSHEFVYVTPDGSVPRVDANGFALAYFAREQLAETMQITRKLQASPEFDLAAFRASLSHLVAARDAEFDILERHLGRLELTSPLPGTDRDAAALYPEVAARLGRLPQHHFLAAREVVARHRDAADAFDLGDFDFVHAPGGHAPMVSFRDDPWLGEILHVAREKDVVISLICHAPVILTSTQFRIGADGRPVTMPVNPFAGITVSTVPKASERAAEDYGYLHVPGQQTRLSYYVDEALEEAGIHNLHKPNPASVEVHYEPRVRVLSTNGPHGIDALAERLAGLIAV